MNRAQGVRAVLAGMNGAQRSAAEDHLYNRPCGCHDCERAAIREFDGNLSRDEAVALTVAEKLGGAL